MSEFSSAFWNHYITLSTPRNSFLIEGNQTFKTDMQDVGCTVLVKKLTVDKAMPTVGMEVKKHQNSACQNEMVLLLS